MHHLNETGTQWTDRGPWAFYFLLGGNFLKNCLITFSLFCHEASQGGCWWIAKRWIWLNHSKGHFSRFERLKKVKFGCFATFCQFSQKRFDNFSLFFSSAVPPGSGAFQMPTRPSSSAAASASTLRGGRANLRNASVTFSLFWHETSLGWH